MINTLLVTGGLGFIGSNFVRLFHDKYKIIILDKYSYGSNPDNLKGINDYVLYKGDINDTKLVLKILKEHNVDAIINFAAESHVDRSISSPLSFIESNTQGVVSLLEAIRTYEGSVRMLHVGTDEEYGEIYEGSFNENSPLNPSSPYSASKASATLFVKAYSRTYGINAVITRSSNNYGPYQFPEKLIPKTIIRASLNLPIPIYGNGNNVRDWIYVSENCEAINLVLNKGRKGEIYNISARQELTNLQVIKKVLEVMGKNDELLKFVDDRPGHDFRYSITNEKIVNLGWRPSIAFEQGIKLTVDWYLSHEDWWKPLIADKVISETPWKERW
ncbi:dTDP-glucose 4,6-dehydratase [Acidianus sp. RZ1]|uniref:dTDP-glucose 4,6-dehydratase n=1 Tax=Acidianus sp. RZ1 TaxID=1540082 RepID=UPI0014924D8C|nr:dTDP-glucose 4,6-dehydratase [Acidianus sp. RZ1]